MAHRFYTKSKREQNRIMALIGLGAFFVVLLGLFVSWITGIYLLGLFTFPLVLSLVAPFFDTPSLVKSGKLSYHSLLFLSEKPAKGVIKIHGGTLFDYVFVMDRKMKGKQRTVFILQQFLEGLLDLVEEQAKSQDGPVKIQGTSYIMNKRTAERIGFKIIKADVVQRLILIFNYFNLMIMSSMAKGRWVFPNLKDTMTFEADLNDLVARKAFIEQMNLKFQSSLLNNYHS